MQVASLVEALNASELPTGGGDPPALGATPTKAAASDSAAVPPRDAVGEDYPAGRQSRADRRGGDGRRGALSDDGTLDSLVLQSDGSDGDVHRPLAEEPKGHPDGFDRPRMAAPGDSLHRFTVPQRIRCADGLPVPLHPTDPEHLEVFPSNDPDADEAAANYQACAWAESITYAALSLYHQRHELDKAGLDQRLAWLAVATRLHYLISAAHYDYSHAAKEEAGLEELYRATDAVPRSVHRGPGWRMFIETVAVDESKASTKKLPSGKSSALPSGGVGAVEVGATPES